MADEDYQNKLQTLYLDMNMLGTNYGSDQQDFIDSFFDDDGELFIFEYKMWQKIKIEHIWVTHIYNKRNK